jgi:hypothetical protein
LLVKRVAMLVQKFAVQKRGQSEEAQPGPERISKKEEGKEKAQLGAVVGR